MTKTMRFRPGFFGGPHMALYNAVMRGPSEWSIGERELMAAFTSKLNQCPFWTESHGAVASSMLADPSVVKAVLDDWSTAPVAPKLKATLGFLKVLTLEPATVGSDHVAPLRAAGVSDATIEDAVYVCAVFNVVDRIADALGFEVPPASYLESRGRAKAGQVSREFGSHGRGPAPTAAGGPVDWALEPGERGSARARGLARGGGVTAAAAALPPATPAGARSVPLVVGLALLVALALRVCGIAYDAPYPFHLHASTRRVRRSGDKLRSFVLSSDLPSAPWQWVFYYLRKTQ